MQAASVASKQQQQQQLGQQLEQQVAARTLKFKAALGDPPFVEGDGTADVCLVTPDTSDNSFCGHAVPIRQTRLTFTLEAEGPNPEVGGGGVGDSSGGGGGAAAADDTAVAAGLSSSDVEMWIAAQFQETPAGRLAASRLGTDSITAASAAAAAVRRFFSSQTDEQERELLRGVLHLVLEATVVAVFKTPKSYHDIHPATTAFIPCRSESNASTLQLQFVVSEL